jgi:biotin carboxylase
MSQVTHVIAGFSAALLPAIDRNFSDGQVLFVEEPAVVRSRNAAATCARHPAVAGILELPSQDEVNAAQLPRMIARPPQLKAVLPGVEYGVQAAATLGNAWCVPGAGLRAARALRDKAELRQVAREAGIPQPEWAVIDGPAAIAGFRELHGGVCVIKPADRQGSLGVALLGPSDDLHRAWDDMLAIKEPGGLRAREQSRQSRYLAEELISGTEVSVQSLVSAGHLIFSNTTIKDVLPGRHPVELGHTLPAPIPDDMADEVIGYTDRLIRRAGFGYGVIHSEWIIDDRTPKLIECAARVPGDSITTLIDFAYGWRFIDAALKVMEGARGLHPPPPLLGASVRFLTAPPGIVREINGIQQAWDMDDVVNVEITTADGDPVRPTQSSLDRVGYVIAVAATAAEARESAARAAAAIEVVTADFPPSPDRAPATGNGAWTYLTLEN